MARCWPWPSHSSVGIWALVQRRCCGSATSTRSCSPVCLSRWAALVIASVTRSYCWRVQRLSRSLPPPRPTRPNPVLLIGARALLGVAGATLAPSTLALIRALFVQPRERTVAVAIWASAFSAGAVLGPMLGGLLLENFWWGSVFLINVPVSVALLVGGMLLLPEQRNPMAGPWDLPSVGLSLIGMLGLVYAVKEGVAHGFRVDIVAVGVVGAAALSVFVRRQLRLPTPLIDVRLFRSRTFSGVIVTNLLAVLGLSGVVYFLSQFFQLVMGYSPLKAGLAELPAAVSATLFGLLAGVATCYVSQRAVLSIGLALVGFAMASLTLIGTSTAYSYLAVALFVLGVGLGLAFAVASDVILAGVPPERAGAAAAMSETGYELGMALGIATIGSVVAGVYHALTIPPGDSAAVAFAYRGFAAQCCRSGKAPSRRPGARDADGRKKRVQQRSGRRRGHRFGTAVGVGGCNMAAVEADYDADTCTALSRTSLRHHHRRRRRVRCSRSRRSSCTGTSRGSSPLSRRMGPALRGRWARRSPVWRARRRSR